MIFQFQHGDSLFHRIDPLSKCIWLICISVLTLSYRIAALQGALLLTVLLTGILCAQLTPYAIWRGIRFPFWFGLPYFALQLLFVPGTTELARIGTFTLTAEALDFAASVSLRLLILVLASLLFIYTTDPRDVVLAMAQKLRVPYRIAFAVSIALRFLPILEAEAALIRAAQKLRGQGEPARLSDRIAWRKRFALAVFTSAVRHVRQTAEAMDMKAFGLYQRRTYRRALTIPRSGITIAAASCVLTIATFVWV